jgi:hypothetical protein
MIKILLFCISLSFFQITAFSQSCLPEGIKFTTQAQIDSFQTDYPGCTSIEGDVNIHGDDISNLAGLSILDSIFGNLEIEFTYLVEDLSGLDNLNYIRKDLIIYYNDGLYNLTGLGNLISVEGGVEIDGNWELTSLTGLDSLISIGGSLQIGSLWGGNPSLTSLSVLDNLASIGDGLSIGSNDNLTSLTGLDNVTSIGGDLQIYENESLASLSGLENINASSISNIWITNNPILSVCHIQNICECLADPHDGIGIYNNGPGCNNPHEVADSCGFELQCLPFGEYNFRSQANVDSFPSYYSNCNNLAGNVWIDGDDIINLDSLYGIDTIEGRLFICGNNNLSSLNGLNNLKTILGELIIGYSELGGNPGLTNMMGLNNLTSVSGGITIMLNSGLLNLSGLDSLSSVGEEFQISGNERLINLQGITSLNYAGSLDISANDSLISLDGLQGLNLCGDISVGYNHMLVTLSGIENLDASQIIILMITNNSNLTECNVRSVCDFLINYSGDVTIVGNSTGCDSPLEVIDACGVGIEEVDSRQSLVVSYPNPVLNQVTFDIRLQEPAKVNLTVYNNLGQVVATILDKSMDKGNHLIPWNAGNLSPGIYFYHLSTANCQLSTSGKMVVVR